MWYHAKERGVSVSEGTVTSAGERSDHPADGWQIQSLVHSDAVGPNVLLVVFDTARADAFEPYGARPNSSPTVQQLASSGLAHQATFSTACWTVPAHGSLFSGQLPRSAGLGHVGGQDPAGFRVAMHDLETDLLPHVLRDTGYATFGVSANAWISPTSGFDTGFDTFRQLTGGRHVAFGSGGIRNRTRWMLDALRARTDDGAEAVTRMLEEWLTSRDGRPFFLFVNLIECHSPYLPPKPWNDLAFWERFQAAREARRHLSLGELWKANVGGFDVPDAAIDRMRRSYAAAIRQLDNWLARVLELLDREGLLADTEVIVTSDHGENLGDGQRLGHAFSLDDRLIRLPFVASGPLDLDTPEVLSIADVPRMLAQSLEIDSHPWSVGPGGGPAVAQFDAPGIAGDRRVGEALALWGLGEEAGHRLCASFTCATDGTLKLLRKPWGEELIDLASDPLEAQSTAVDAHVEAAHGVRLQALRSALDEAEASERTPPRAIERDDPVLADDELEAQMRLLGYL